MSETEFRLAYDALMERMPDPPPYEEIRGRMVKPRPQRTPAGWQAAVVSAVLVLIVLGGAAWLAGGGSQPGDTVDAASAVEDRLQEVLRELGPLCGQSSIQGDFDGDGLPDIALIGARRPESGCPTGREDREWILAVAWSTGASGWSTLPKCGVIQPDGRVTSTGICAAFAAPDLNDDGRAELAVKTQQAAGSVSILHFYQLPAGETSPAPLEVAPGGPGPGEITPGQVFSITFGSSPDYEHNLRCETSSDGAAVFLVTAAESRGNEWSVFEGTWRLDGTRVAFLSQRTYSMPKDAPEADDLIARQSICGAPINTDVDQQPSAG